MVQQHLKARGQSCLFCYDIWNIYFNQQTPAKVIQHGHHDSEFLWRLVEIQIYQSRGAPLSRDEKNSDTVLPKQTAKWKWEFVSASVGFGKINSKSHIQSPQHPLAHLAAWIWNWKWLILGKILLACGCCYISKNESWMNTWQLLGFQNAAVNQFRCRMLSFSSCKQPFGFAKDITFWKNSSGISWVVTLRSNRIISCLVGDFYKPSPVLLGRGTTQRIGLSSAKPKNVKNLISECIFKSMAWILLL